MRGSALLLVIVGLLLFYVVISDKFYCFEGCASCLMYGDSQSFGGEPTVPSTAKPLISSPAPIPSISSQIQNGLWV